MSFLTLNDIPPNITDVTIDPEQIEEANLYVQRVLISRGIDPSQVDPQNPHLKKLALSYALYRSYLVKHAGQDSVYLEKAKEIKKDLEELEKSITPELLGIESSTGKSFGTFRIRRA